MSRRYAVASIRSRARIDKPVIISHVAPSATRAHPPAARMSLRQARHLLSNAARLAAQQQLTPPRLQSLAFSAASETSASRVRALALACLSSRGLTPRPTPVPVLCAAHLSALPAGQRVGRGGPRLHAAQLLAAHDAEAWRREPPRETPPPPPAHALRPRRLLQRGEHENAGRAEAEARHSVAGGRSRANEGCVGASLWRRACPPACLTPRLVCPQCLGCPRRTSGVASPSPRSTSGSRSCACARRGTRASCWARRVATRGRQPGAAAESNHTS